MNTAWSSFQTALFNEAEHGTGNVICEAVAGSGKTTTGVEMTKRVRGSYIYLAFGKAIATELCRRGVYAKTFHALCYSVVLRHLGLRTVETDKLRQLVRENLGDRDIELYGAFITRLVTIGRDQGIGCLVDDTPDTWADLAAHHDLELESASADYTRAITLASKLLQASYADKSRVDFGDLLYITVRDGLQLPTYDNIFIDEAQDTNLIQRAIIRKLMHRAVTTSPFGDVRCDKVSRIFAVGDSAQAIYGFRGADSDSMELIASEFNCTRLPLSITYRCPRKVVDFARTWVSHITAAETAADGIVEHVEQWKTSIFKAQDLIVCRTTRPLVSLVYTLIKADVPATILGKEIGQGLVSLVKKLNATGIDNLVERLTIYTNREVQKAVAKGNEEKAAAVQDKTDAVLFLIDALTEDARTIPGLFALIDRLFSDVKNVVTLSTIHKAKGLEADRVFWLDSSKCPAKWARQPWQQQQEKNLCYVAATRAKQALYLIESTGCMDGPERA